jgi:hypothetical protein
VRFKDYHKNVSATLQLNEELAQRFRALTSTDQPRMSESDQTRMRAL